MRTVSGILLATTVSLLAAGSIKAATLHGFCPGCVDGGSNTPTTANPLVNFGFIADPGPQTGDYRLEILTQGTGLNFSVTGTQGGINNNTSFTGSSVFEGLWGSGNLDSFLGFNASPNNPIGAYATFGHTSFDVYQIDLGQTTLQALAANGPIMDLGQLLSQGSYIVAFLEPNGIATPNSAAILETGQMAATPLPGALPLLGTALAGGWALLRRRRSVTA